MNYLKKITLLFLLTFGLSLFAQKPVKEGMISMKITMSSENEQANASLASIGNMITTTYFKGQKSSTEMNNPMTGESTTIIDVDKKEMLMLLNNPMLGKKFKKSTIDTSESDQEKITVTETGDTKDIAGYVCKGYNVVIDKDGNKTKLTMYVTDKITAPTQQNIKLSKKVKGYPMHMVVNVNQGGIPITTLMEVVEVKAEKVDDSKFDMKIPEGYTEMAEGN